LEDVAFSRRGHRTPDPPRIDVAFVGVDLGQRVDPTCLVVADPQPRLTGRRIEVRQYGDGSLRLEEEIATYYVIRHIERLPLGLDYTAVGRRLAEAVAWIRNRKPNRTVRLHIDQTGLGKPVIDLLRSQLAGVRKTTITGAILTATDRLDGLYASPEVRVGKQFLATRTLTLAELDRIHLPDTDEARLLLEELKSFEGRVRDTGSFSVEAKVGSHDDLVISLALACLFDPLKQRVKRGPSIWR
jgi:hypothetical protein